MRRSINIQLVVTFFAMPFGCLFAADGEPTQPISLVDLRGNLKSLPDFNQSPLRVVVFLGAECPLSNLYLPTICELEKTYRPRSVQFLAVYPQRGESVDQIAAHAYDHDVPFPVLRDEQGRLAESLRAERVPSVCLLDKEGAVCYRGRIDDQYGVGTKRPKPTRLDLKQAIDEQLEGKKISVAETLADGCLIDRTPETKPKHGVTFAKDVSRILQNKCEECHRTGRIGPFELSTYNDAQKWSQQIKEAVTRRQMPPWHADPRFGVFHNDRRLTDEERTTLVHWVDSGAPLGNENDLPPRKAWADDWEMGTPDVVLKMPRPQVVPANGVVPYRYIVVPTQFTEDKWVVAAEGKPGNPAVVHHIIVYLMSPKFSDPFGERDGEMSVLTEWAPGNGPVQAPAGTAIHVPRGSTLLIEMHYTPNGTEQTDQSMVGVRFASQPPERLIRANLFANSQIVIPPHDPHHKESREYRFEQESRVLAFLPHMHWRGKHFEYVAHFPDGRTERLLSVPRWDFNWQTGYWFDRPLNVPKGTRIKAIATWDNSAYNPANPDPNKSVTWGLQTWDEMMVGWMYYVYEKPDTDEVAHAGKNETIKLASAGMFRVMDRNKDGWIGGKEIPPQFRPLLEQIGIDLDPGLDPVAYDFIYKIIMNEMKRRPNPSPQGQQTNTPSNASATRTADQAVNTQPAPR